jgi:hypothetical protein
MKHHWEKKEGRGGKRERQVGAGRGEREALHYVSKGGMVSNMYAMVSNMYAILCLHCYVCSNMSALLCLHRLQLHTLPLSAVICTQVAARHYLYTLPLVLRLLHLKHELVEVLLQRFVRVVNAQLLEPILLEYLKAKNVEYSDEAAHAFVLPNSAVDSLDQILE